jgi:hypothetical protein
MHSERFLRLVDAVGPLEAVRLYSGDPKMLNRFWSDREGFNQTDRDFLVKHYDSVVAIIDLKVAAHRHFAQTKDPA